MTLPSVFASFVKAARTAASVSGFTRTVILTRFSLGRPGFFGWLISSSSTHSGFVASTFILCASARVVGLFDSRRPFDIPRLVIPVIVDSLNGEFGTWLSTDVTEKKQV